MPHVKMDDLDHDPTTRALRSRLLQLAKNTNQITDDQQKLTGEVDSITSSMSKFET